jgi:putative peptidoglycan lipid II flippase
MTSAVSIDAAPAKPWRSGVLFDTLTISVWSILGKISGAAKSVAVASVFGSGAALDSYLLAFLVPSLLADTFCGALVPVTVPRLIELGHRDDRAGSIAFYGQVLRRSLFFSLLGSAAIAIGIGLALLLGGSVLTSRWRVIGTLALVMLPVIPCNAVANVWRAVLNSERHFAIPAVALTSVVVMIFVLAVGRLAGVWALAAGTTLGAASELALLGVAIRRAGFPVVPRPYSYKPVPLRMDEFRKEYGYLVASAAVSGGMLLIGQAMAASLETGSVSVFNYGTRLAGVLMAIGPAALSVAVLPRFSQMVAERDWEELKHSLRRLICGSAAVSAAATAVLMLLSSWIVRLTLQHGVFTAADTNAVAAVQAWSLLQLPFVVGISIFTRLFSALNANRFLLPLSAGALVANLMLTFSLIGRYGVIGISLASSLTEALVFAAMAGLVFRRGGVGLLRQS